MERVEVGPEVHRSLAADLFNEVWTLLEKPDRTSDDDDRMVHAAHASRYHWGVLGVPVNLARGEWQVARVYSVLGRAEPALHHARRCLQICEEHDIVGFDLAAANEALARAYVVAGDVKSARHHAGEARRLGEAVEDEEDREILFTDLAGLPE